MLLWMEYQTCFESIYCFSRSIWDTPLCADKKKVMYVFDVFITKSRKIWQDVIYDHIQHDLKSQYYTEEAKVDWTLTWMSLSYGLRREHERAIIQQITHFFLQGRVLSETQYFQEEKVP